MEEQHLGSDSLQQLRRLLDLAELLLPVLTNEEQIELCGFGIELPDAYVSSSALDLEARSQDHGKQLKEADDENKAA